MAKRLKSGKVIKKRKPKNVNETVNQVNTEKPFDFFNSNGGDLGRGPLQQEVEEVRRANEKTYMFISDNRVFIRDLSELTLSQESVRLQTRIYELRNKLHSFENLMVQMSREKDFRGL